MTASLWIALSVLLGLQEGPVFRDLTPAPEGTFSYLERDGRIVGVDLDPRLPGVPTGKARFRFPFAEPVERVELLINPDPGACTVLVVGGVRASLAIHVLRTDGVRAGLRFPGGRLLHNFFRPVVDDRAIVFACVFADKAGVQLRVFTVTPGRAALMLARTLERPPPRLVLRSPSGDPRVQVPLGDVPLRAPGQVEFAVPESPPSFLHPWAALPEPGSLRIDFGELSRNDRRTLPCELSNRGRFPLRLLLRVAAPEGWTADLEPSALMLPPGARRSVNVTLSCAQPTESRLRAILEVGAVSGAGGPLVGIALTARGLPSRDQVPPRLDPTQLEHRLLSGRRARITGRPGAVQDESLPGSIGDPTGVTAPVAADGSFRLEIPLDLDGRVRLWTRDGEGNRGKLRYVATIQDRTPPRWDKDKVELGFPVLGRTAIRGAAGAVRDETPPVWIEIDVDGQRQDAKVSVAPDGSFSVVVEAGSGQQVRLVALDGAAPLNRSDPLVLGPVLPYVARVRGRLVLHGPPGASFRLAPTLPGNGGAPETPLTVFVGELDGKGEAWLEESKLRGAALLRFVVEVPTDGRVLEGHYRQGKGR